MAHFQRVPFELLPPEQQQELMDKQLSYKRQREMLLQQMEEKKRNKQNEPKKRQKIVEDDEPVYSPPDYQSQIAYNQSNETTDNFVIPPLQNLSVTLPQQKPLLTERQRHIPKSTFNPAATFTSTQIKDSFTNLRHQIRSTAANAVLSTGTMPQSARSRHISSFNDSGHFNF